MVLETFGSIIKEEQLKTVERGILPNTFVLENLGLKVKIQGRGFVREQSVLPGTRAVKGRQITLRLSV